MRGGDPKFCRFLGNDLRKKIPALQIYHNPLGTILYIAIKKCPVSATFCPESQYIYCLSGQNVAYTAAFLMAMWGQNLVSSRFVKFCPSFLISRKKMLKTNLKNEKFFLYQKSQIVDLTEISAIWGPVLTSFWVKDTKKWYIFCVWSRLFCQGGAVATPLKSASL